MTDNLNTIVDGDVSTNKLSTLQRTLYIIAPEISTEEASNLVSSRLYKDPMRCTLYSVPKRMELETGAVPTNIDTGDEKFTNYSYIIPPTCQRLLHLCVTINPPSLSVKDAYRDFVEIRYCNNLAHNIVRQAELVIPGNTNLKPYIDCHYLDFLRAKDIDDLESYDDLIGNRPSLTQWSDSISTDYPITCPLKFFIDEDPSFALPAHLFQMQYQITLKIKYKLSIASLLCMRMKNEEGVWIERPPKLELLEKSELMDFATPKVSAYYRKLTEAELASEVSGGVEMVIQQIVPLSHIKEFKSSTINLGHGDLSLRGIKYAFLNSSRSKRNDHSFYTLEDQSDAQINYLLEIDEDSGVTESIHSTLIDGYYYHKRGCKYVHDIAFDFSQYSVDAETSRCLKDKTKLTIQLKLPEYPPEGDISTKYKVDWDAEPKEIVKSLIKEYELTTSKRDLKGSKNPRLTFIGYLRVIVRVRFCVSRVQYIF